MTAPIDQAVRIVRKALDTAPNDLDTFLTDECEGDAELRRLAETMLHEAADIVDETERKAAVETPDPLLGQRLGAFRVLERIGRGGMGVIYRGMREGADFTQVVALKLIRRGFDFDDVSARFLRERRILARLNHPNLARFIDGGVAPDGRPWFALEFVQGQPLLAWCDDHRLDVRGRVKLFLDVCAAVQYAHAQLVVHRDLKPGNVLVDADGVPRLLDFGISRLLEGDEGEATLTVAGHRYALTPEYAAPEQFGGEAGVAADVYSLGTILYQLVSGVLPYALDRRDLAEAERIVRTTQPQPLAQAIARADATDAIEARLQARSTSLRAYRASVRGDLSRILDKALAKEPERRYATVEAFADDLSRWLAGAPVRVSGNKFGYRFGKLVRRNRAASALVVLALLAVVASFAGMAWQVRQTRLLALHEAQVKDQLIDLFTQTDEHYFGDDFAVERAFLDRGVARLRQLPLHGAVREELAGVLVGIYYQIASLDRGVELAEQELGTPIDPERAAHADLRLLAGWARMRYVLLRREGLREVLERALRVHADTQSLAYIEAVGMLARIDIAERRFAEAEQYARQSVALLESRFPPSDRRVVADRLELAAALVGQRKNREGREQSELALSATPASDGWQREFGLTMAALRRALFGEFDSAETLYVEVEERDVRLDLNWAFPTLSHAVNVFDLGRVQRACELLAAWESRQERKNRPIMPDTRYEFGWLRGECALHEHDDAQAAAAFADAAAAARTVELKEPFTVYLDALRAVALIRMGDADAAKKALDGARMLAATLPHADFSTTMLAAAEGVVASARGEHAVALAALDSALDELAHAKQYDAALEDQLRENRDAVRIRVWKAQAELAAGRADLARATAREARELGLATLGAQHPFMRELDEVDATEASRQALTSAGRSKRLNCTENADDCLH